MVISEKELEERVRLCENTSITNWSVFIPHRVFIEVHERKDEETEEVCYAGAVRFMLDDIRSITIMMDRVGDDPKWMLRQTALSIVKAWDSIPLVGLVFGADGQVLNQFNLDELFAEAAEEEKPKITADSFPPMTNMTVH